MSDTFVLESAISYWNVDREQVVTLTGLFKLLQEGAIRHADQHNLGSQSMRTRGESWILNRIAARIHRYPRYGEAVRLETWSSGIRGFKGYREFRLQAGGELVVEASSLWLYVDIGTKSLVRVPRELAAAFPERAGAVFHPDLDKLRLDEAPADSASQEISLRYSDIDSNGHVNNAAYFDYLQTALALTGGPAHPTHVELHFVKEIPPALDKVMVRVARRADGALASFTSGADCFARARLRG
jgi:medium-chain acyl-[acyl-carrier-protein] hydrolase